MTSVKTYCFDLDGVVFTLVADLDYAKALPVEKTVRLINHLYDGGHTIKLYTARGSATGKDWRNVTEEQLRACGLRYHELHFGKPAADYYIDDHFISLESLYDQFSSVINQ